MATPIPKKLIKLAKDYKERFGDFFPTEEVGGSYEYLTTLLSNCLKEGKTYEELTGDYDEEDMDY